MDGVITLLLGAPLGPQGVLEFAAPSWLPWAAAGVAAFIFALTAASARRSPPIGLELLLLALGLAPLVFAAAGPQWVEASGRTEPPRYAVLIDDSRSMGVIEDGEPRHAAVAEALERLGQDRVEVFRFGAELEVGEEGAFDQPSTDLGGALRAIRARYAGERLAGVAVITDGLDRGGLRRRFRDDGAIEDLDLPGPLSVYQVGRAGEVQDLAVAELDAGGFAFIHTPFTLTARLEGSGFAGKTVPVTLTRDGQLVASREVKLDDDGRAELSFTVRSRQAGRFIYEVSVPVYDGDAVPGNNSMPVAVRVVRDRLRVLQVCGAPSFDQKFLRLFLKQDPAIDLVSFFILRTNDDVNTSGYTDKELSLIRFPYEQLFSEELDSFDLVIFQNFDYKSFFGHRGDTLLGNIASHVKKGKAFVMIGGDRSFDLGEYGPTELGRVLPVRLGLGGEPVDTESFSPVLTAQGRVHPITRILGDATENEALWARLSPLDGLNLSAGANRGSAVLLAHPTLKTAEGAPMPVVAVREVGFGRTMALMGDSSWRWVMAEAAKGQGNQAYLRFWKNAFRWLLRDPEAERVQVETARENYLVGEDVRVVVQVRDVGFEPVEGAKVTGQAIGPSGAVPIEAESDGFGEASITLVADDKGPWRVAVEAKVGDQVLGEAETVFAVTARDPELAEINPDEAFLAQLAADGGGAWFKPGEYAAPVRDEGAGRYVDETRRTPLWSAPLLPLWVGLLLSLSWWRRRRRGLR